MPFGIPDAAWPSVVTVTLRMLQEPVKSGDSSPTREKLAMKLYQLADIGPNSSQMDELLKAIISAGPIQYGQTTIKTANQLLNEKK